MKQASLFSDQPSSTAESTTVVPALSARARPLTAAQRRFNTLLKQVDALRADLERWESFTDVHARRVSSELLPRIETLREQQLELAQLLDRQYAGAPLSKRNRRVLRELLLGLLEELLEEEECPELLALYDRHAPNARADEQRMEYELLRALADELPVDADAYTGEESLEAFAAWLQDALDEPPPRRGSRRSRASAPAPEPPRDEPDSPALRTVFRRLANKLHPDRETDAGEHQRKTELMQELNAAYAAGDLLRVLELQQRVDSRAADALGALDDAQLKPYLSTLQRQAKRLRAQVEELTAPFRSLVPVPSGRTLTPQAVQREFDRALTELNLTQRRVQQDLHRFADVDRLREVLDEAAGETPWVRRARGARRR